jgi:hypothetical protein
MKETRAVRAEFDAIARAGAERPDPILHDLWRSEGPMTLARDAARLPFKIARLLQLGAPLRHTPEERAAWRAHDRDDVHLTRPEVRALRDRFFPGGRLYEHFLWRYTIDWRASITSA